MATHRATFNCQNEDGVRSGGVLVHVSGAVREMVGRKLVEWLEEGEAHPTFLFSAPTDITCSTSLTLLATNEERSLKKKF